jgi:hypothetical protein
MSFPKKRDLAYSLYGFSDLIEAFPRRCHVLQQIKDLDFTDIARFIPRDLGMPILSLPCSRTLPRMYMNELYSNIILAAFIALG